MSERDDALGSALGRVPSGIFVCSCGTGDASRPFIASWVMQSSFDPPSVSVAIEDGRDALEVLGDSDGRFTLSILPADSGHAMMKPFFSGDAERPYGDLATLRTEDDGIYLADALAWLECRELTRCRAGQHVLVVGEVLTGGTLRDGEPLVHVRKTGYSY